MTATVVRRYGLRISRNQKHPECCLQLIREWSEQAKISADTKGKMRYAGYLYCTCKSVPVAICPSLYADGALDVNSGLFSHLFGSHTSPVYIEIEGNKILIPYFSFFKGTVQRDLRGVKSGINR
jgi:hypothetical protein